MFEKVVLVSGLILGATLAVAQGVSVDPASASDVTLLAKARKSYDTPFKRNLASFNCSVDFDWKQHVIDLLGKVPEPLTSTVDGLQKVEHRVSVDSSHATLTTLPGASDLSTLVHGQDLEGVLDGVATSGLNAWVPSGADLLLPSGPTHYRFTPLETGYELELNGPGVAAKLILSDDLRMTSGVSQQPQPLRFDTGFVKGPDGFLLSSLKTGDTSGSGHNAEFHYAYQNVEGFQLPTEVTIKSSAGETWRIYLRDCKVVKFVRVKVQSTPLKPQ